MMLLASGSVHIIIDAAGQDPTAGVLRRVVLIVLVMVALLLFTLGLILSDMADAKGLLLLACAWVMIAVALTVEFSIVAVLWWTVATVGFALFVVVLSLGQDAW